LSLTSALNLVSQFHKRVGAPVADHPRLLACNARHARHLTRSLLEIQGLAKWLASINPHDELIVRLALALEELGEWLAAHAEGNLVAAADAWADRLYLLLGDAVATGLPADELLEEVHASNMTKSADELRTGKAIKGAEYRPPDIRRILDLARLSR